MRIWWVLFLPALAYQLLAAVAGYRFLQARRRSATQTFQPPVSVLKPVRGLDPNTYAAFVSQAAQNYHEFELLFGVNDDSDPAIPEIRRLQAAFPGVPISLVRSTTQAPNAKVGVLIDLARHAKHPVWVVNDSDILVTPDYLRSVVTPLGNSAVGVVTCPYRASAHSAASAFEAVGIATDFMPSALVAQVLGVREFGFGSTLAFRAADLNAAGGFEVIAPYIADDYQLAQTISKSGKRALLSGYIVETALGEGSWSGIWAHQLRWARTIRATKGAGHLGLPITHAGLWVFAALLSGALFPAALLLLSRLSSAFISARLVLSCGSTLRMVVLAPFWDLYAFAVWACSYLSRRVRWRNRTLVIGPQGRIVST